MREAGADVAAMMQSFEKWCPVFTPVWPNEVANVFDINLIKKAEDLGLQIFVECVEDPSVKTRRLNFWSIFYLCALEQLGEDVIVRMINDDTLTFWSDIIETAIQAQTGGVMSVSVAEFVAHRRFYERYLLAASDWNTLSEVFVRASVCMAACLYTHRIRSDSGFSNRTNTTVPVVV